MSSPLLIEQSCPGCAGAGERRMQCVTCGSGALFRPATAADLTRDLVRAYLARDPEAAAKVAGAWRLDAPAPDGESPDADEDVWSRQDGPRRSRFRFAPDGREVVRVLSTYGHRMPSAPWCWVRHGWTLPGGCNRVGDARTRAEAEAAVDALLAADGWVLGTIGEEVSRG